MNVFEELTQSEKESLEWKEWYLFIRNLKEKDIKLFFKRLRDIQLQRISSGNSDEQQTEETLNTLKGITFVESKFLQIKKETLTNS